MTRRNYGMVRLLWAFLACATLPGAALAAGPAASDEAAGAEPIVQLLELVMAADEDSARQCLDLLADKIETGEIGPRPLATMRPRLQKLLQPALGSEGRHPLFLEAAVLATGWRDPQATAALRRVLADTEETTPRRMKGLRALVAIQDPQVLDEVAQILHAPQANPLDFRGQLLLALGRSEQPAVGEIVLRHYGLLEPTLQPKAVELLTQRAAWSKALLHAIGRKQVPAHALNVNQVARLQAGKDPELRRLVTEKWGAVRQERNPQRESVLAEMRDVLASAHGDPQRGQLVFHKVCGQCHQIYGRGQKVGPDITANGRSSYAQLLSNVFDPSLVIGAAYQAHTVITADGRVVSGLLTEDSPQRVVLSLQGGKREVIAREAVEEVQRSRLSLMPEGFERQMPAQELADLFAFLVLDGPPEDPRSQIIAGAPAGLVATGR